MPKSLVENRSVRRTRGTINEKVYCHESYAQELYNMMVGSIPTVMNKDLREGEVSTVIAIDTDANGDYVVDLPGFVPANVAGARQQEFFDAVEIVSTPDGVNTRWRFAGNNQILRPLEVIITASAPYLTGSFIDAHIETLHNQFTRDLAINNRLLRAKETRNHQVVRELTPRCNWYLAKIVQRTPGGFIVDIGGIQAFLPGSLAAANKIIDFEAFVGKDVRVMIEGYDVEKGTFIVSNKRYIDFILPSAIKSLTPNTHYTATVTGVGTSMNKTEGRIPFGVFLEFEEILTGLLHISEMDGSTHDDLMTHNIRPGQTIGVWVKEVTKDNRIILTQVSPEVRSAEIKELKEQLEGLVLEGTIRIVKEYGSLIDIGSGLTGLLPKNETKRMKLYPESRIAVSVAEVNIETGKILLARVQ